MAEENERIKQLITTHKKIVAKTQKIIDESKELVSLLKTDIERQEELLVQQRKELDKLLDDLHFGKE